MQESYLLADDHQIVRQALKTLLEGEGLAVVAEAADGREAVRSGREPDVAVLDFSMPLLNGLGAAREILCVKKISIHGTAGLVRYALRRALVQS